MIIEKLENNFMNTAFIYRFFLNVIVYDKMFTNFHKDLINNDNFKINL